MQVPKEEEAPSLPPNREYISPYENVQCVRCKKPVKWRSNLELTDEQTACWFYCRKRDAAAFEFNPEATLCMYCRRELNADSIAQTKNVMEMKPKVQLRDGNKQWLVDGSYGPPWPMDISCIMEPETDDITKHSSSCTHDKQEKSIYEGSIRQSASEVRSHSDESRKNAGSEKSLLGPMSENLPSLPRVMSGSENRNSMDKKRKFEGDMKSNPFGDSRKIGHRFVKGKLVPIPLHLAHKNYKAPLQLTLAQFVSKKSL